MTLPTIFLDKLIKILLIIILTLVILLLFMKVTGLRMDFRNIGYVKIDTDTEESLECEKKAPKISGTSVISFDEWEKCQEKKKSSWYWRWPSVFFLPPLRQ